MDFNDNDGLGNADIGVLGNLTNLRLLELYGLDKIWISYEPTLSLEKITDLSVLVNCPRLKYLHLTTGNVENYDFLGELPEMYSVVLEGERHMKNVAPVRPSVRLMPVIFRAIMKLYIGNWSKGGEGDVQRKGLHFADGEMSCG